MKNEPANNSESTIAVAVDAGDLQVGGGLMALVRPALMLLEPGGVLAINSCHENLQDDLSVWCKIKQHEYLGHEPLSVAAEQPKQMIRHLIRRGTLSVPLGDRETNMRLESVNGRLSADAVLSAVPMPETADPHTGFAPRGSQVESGGPRYPFDLLDRDHVAPPEVAKLYDQAVESQWVQIAIFHGASFRTMLQLLKERSVRSLRSWLKMNFLRCTFRHNLSLEFIRPMPKWRCFFRLKWPTNPAILTFF